MDAEGAAPPMTFSTDFFSARDRLPYFREVFGRWITRLDLSPSEDRPLHCSATRYGFDGLEVISGRTNGLISRRTRSLLADGHDDFIFITNLSGASLVTQHGQESLLNPGGAVLLSSADVGTKDSSDPTQFLLCRVPRRLLKDRTVEAEDMLARPIPGSAEAVRLLVGYVQMALQGNQLATPQLRRLFTGHVYDLIALAVGANRDAAELARRRGVGAARLKAAKAFIQKNVGRPGLSVGSAAAHLGVTPRYVHMLFEVEGSSFTRYMLRERLARALELLLDPRMAERPISAIAYAAGFNDLSHFNRLFRSHFGRTPSEARQANAGREA
jgi:AraC-like DNA-binding protein